MRIWLVDDSEDVHQVAQRTVNALPGLSLTRFYSGAEALTAFAQLEAAHPAELPRVILMDFYIGDERGDAVTLALRRLEPATSRSTIVGYSSMQSASERILGSGGDVVVRKHRSQDGLNPSLYRFLAGLQHSR